MHYLIGVLTFLLLMTNGFAQEDIEKLTFKNQRRSSIKWDKIEPLSWLNFQGWVRDLRFKEAYPDWYYALLDSRNKELMGRVIKCVGVCQVYRGEGVSKAKFFSSLREGDEILTRENSYLWLFLLDGTLVRLSPKSSISLKEIAIGKTENFVFSRLNYGQIQWLSRQEAQFKTQSLHETDPLFYPLGILDSSPTFDEKKEESLYEMLSEPNYTVHQYKRLNSFIEKNNKLTMGKKTYTYLVLPNATLKGYNLNLNAFSILGDKSVFKVFSAKDLYQEEMSLDQISAGLRGFSSSQGRWQEVQWDMWYQVGPEGKFLAQGGENRDLRISEVFIQRIPTILIAREILLTKLSSFAFDPNATPKEMAEKHGYRLWEVTQEKGKTDLEMRKKFLDEYMRRAETSLSKEAMRLRELHIKRGIKVAKSYNRGYYVRAMQAYLNSMPALIQRKTIDELRLRILRVKNANGRL